MDNETRIKLLEAGYTKEEIEAGEPVGTPEGASDNKEGESGEQSAADQEHESEVNENKSVQELTNTVKELADIVKKLQTNNINNANANKKADNGVSDVINSFIQSM